MAPTKFGAGQRVAVMRSNVAGVYRIVSVLPRDSGPQQYRVRNDGETFDRIIDEGRLEAANYD